MTVQSSLARVPYTILGTGPYTIPFYFLADADIIAIRTPVGGGNPVTLTPTTDYTLSGAGNENGGALTLVITGVDGDTLTIINEPTILQLTQYPETGKFPAASHERALDKLTMIAKRVYDLASRSLRLNDGDTATSLELPVSSPGKLIGWDVNGELANTSAAGVGPGSIGTTELANDAVTLAKIADPTLGALAALNSTAGLVEQTGADAFTKTPITAFAKTLLDDADAATARATLGVSKPVIQRRRNTQSAVASTTAIIPYDDTIPQITEGGLLFSEPFTPLSANSRIRITTTVQLRANAENIVRTVAVFRAGVADALGVSAAYCDPAAAGGYGFSDVTCTVDIPSPGTSAQTFEVRYGPHAASTLYVNADSAGTRRYGGAFATFVEIEEYLP